MTDGGIVLDDRGVQTKRYHVRDGTGLAVWRRLGYEVCLITGRTSQALVHRAEELGITHVIQGSRDKAASLAEVLGTLGLDEQQAACLADDLPDLPMMKRAGYPMAVADAVPEVRAAARFVTTLPGGQGAVREAIEHLLKEKHRWSDAVELFQ
jgi:3-deoxy-D-manno-octulosonate 8-phosphate phosphatase (KDO 8-P phosphatase)